MSIYADHAATTAMSEAAIDAMTRCMREYYGNPSSLYRIGQRAKEVLEQAREDIASVIHAEPNEIVFTISSPRLSSIMRCSIPWSS